MKRYFTIYEEVKEQYYKIPKVFMLEESKYFEMSAMAKLIYSILSDRNSVSIKNKFNNGDLTCEWCGTKTFMLNSHHYPIPKSQGGKKVVHICPNCHYEFHYLSGMTYEE